MFYWRISGKMIDVISIHLPLLEYASNNSQIANYRISSLKELRYCVQLHELTTDPPEK
jgi:hypothetical protein